MTTSQGWKSRFPAVNFQIRDPNDPDGVPGSYIIMLKTGSDLKAHMDWLRSAANSMRSEDIKIGYEYETLNGYSAELTDDGLSAIAASPDVKSINQDTRVRIC
ncbi:hypothetical protein FRC12_000144 [Ceratobasidium sp. 428]|nr:hypothetical protein FRC12_000144 [Ceratobasidium sp. 428]